MRSSSLSVGSEAIKILALVGVLGALAAYGYCLKLAYDFGFLLFWVYYVTIYM